MKAKKLVTLTLAAAMVAASSVSVFAAELTDTDSTGQTEVKAHISGNAGNVSYIITIPDVIDFGELTQPEDNSTDHFKDVNYEVKATKIHLTLELGYIHFLYNMQSYQQACDSKEICNNQSISENMFVVLY